MKQLILLLFCLTLCITGVSATHIKGGFITYKKDQGPNPNPRTLFFTLTTLSNTESEVEDPSLIIDMGDGNTMTVNRQWAVKINNSTQRNEYNWIYTYGADGNFTVSWNGINRNNKILNIGSPSQDVSIYISSTVSVNAIRGFNSGPQFLAPEAIVGSIGVAINYNLLAHDPDGDSLAYKLITPLRKDAYGKVTSVPGYTFPGKTFSCGSNTGAPVSEFKLDSINGQLVWDAACRQGEYAVAIVIEEWRVSQENGNRVSVKLGEVNYDMQILTTFEPQSRILIENRNSLKFTQEGFIQAKADQESELRIYYFDLAPANAPIRSHPDSSAIVRMIAGELSQLFNTNITLTFEDAEYGTIATFRFTPDKALIRNRPYFISFYGKKDNFSKTQSFGIWVRSEDPLLTLNGKSNVPKTPEGHLKAVTNKASKYSFFAENMPGYALKLSVESPLAAKADEFTFTERDSIDGKIGELLFKPSEQQISDAPQLITFKATYTSNNSSGGRMAGNDPIVKEVNVKVVVSQKQPTASPEELEIKASLVYPNPVQDRFFVRTEVPATFQIYTLQGQILLDQKVTPGITEVIKPFNTPGLYFYTLTSSNGHKKTGKLLAR